MISSLNGTGTVGIILVVANIIFSYFGLSKQSFFERYKFEVDRILVDKEYRRMISSGFLHVSWTHLIFNMFSLYVFSVSVEAFLGPVKFLAIYFASLLGGNLLALYIHRNHGDYSSAGASGAISGIIFASIALFPGMGVGAFMLPIYIPGWLYGLVYVLFSIYAIKSKRDNIGHEAHLGGALIGMLAAIIMVPEAMKENYLTILFIAIPAVAFIYIVVTKPHILLVDDLYIKSHRDLYSIDHKYNEERNKRQQEVDRILDKISKKGMSSLNDKEKEILKKNS